MSLYYKQFVAKSTCIFPIECIAFYDNISTVQLPLTTTGQIWYFAMKKTLRQTSE